MNRTFAVISLLAVFAFGTFAIGCGGDDDGGSGGATAASDEKSLRQIGAKLRKITRTGNAEQFCDLFEPSRLDDWVSRDQCVEIFGPALKRTPKGVKYEVKDVKIDGDKAEVTFDYGTAKFEKIDGKWYAETPSGDDLPDEIQN